MDVSDKYVACLMRYPPYVKIFSPNGEILFQWGTQGQGPSDLTTVRDICVVDNEVWILNVMPNRVTQFSLEGSYKRHINLDHIFWLVRLECSNGMPVVEGGPWNSREHKIYQLVGKSIKEVASLTRGQLVQIKTKSAPKMNLELAFQERNYWTTLQGKSIVMSSKDQILWIAEKHVTWRLDSKRFRVSANSQNEWLKRVLPGVELTRNGSSELLEKLRALPFPKVFPPVLDLMADRERLWVLRAYRENDQYWECYEQGARVKTLELPCGFKVQCFYRDSVFAINLDDADFPLITNTF